MVFRKSRMD